MEEISWFWYAIWSVVRVFSRANVLIRMKRSLNTCSSVLISDALIKQRTLPKELLDKCRLAVA